MHVFYKCRSSVKYVPEMLLLPVCKTSVDWAREALLARCSGTSDSACSIVVSVKGFGGEDQRQNHQATGIDCLITGEWCLC